MLAVTITWKSDIFNIHLGTQFQLYFLRKRHPVTGSPTDPISYTRASFFEILYYKSSCYLSNHWVKLEWNLLISILGLWSTKDMNDDLNRENSVRTTVRELVVYILFLTVLVACKLRFNKSFKNAENIFCFYRILWQVWDLELLATDISIHIQCSSTLRSLKKLHRFEQGFYYRSWSLKISVLVFFFIVLCRQQVIKQNKNILLLWQGEWIKTKFILSSSLYVSLNLSLSLRDRDRADTSILFHPPDNRNFLRTFDLT